MVAVNTKEKLPLAMPLGEKVKYIVTLIHDEFLESVMAGQKENYSEWTEFMGECLTKVVVPNQRDA